MGKSYFGETEEQRGSLPALTGALMEVVGVERGKTGENAKVPGCRRYTIELKVVEPKEYAGSIVRDYITVGTAEDPLAKRPETWNRSEAGPGRLKRFLTRSGTPLSDDDEEWMEAAEGRQVVAPVSARPSDDGDRIFNSPGLYYRPSDEDAPEIGENKDAGKGGKKAKGAAAAGRRAREGKPTEAEAEEEPEKPKKPAKPAPKEEEEEEEEEQPKKPAKKPKPAAEEEDDD